MLPQYTVEKLLALGAKTVTLSDSSGCIYDPDGIDADKLALREAAEKCAEGKDKCLRRKISDSDLYPEKCFQ